MPEWWETCPAEEVVDGFIENLYEPQYPSAGIYMYITKEETLAQVRAIILHAEVADKDTLQTLNWIARRPYQYHHLRMPHAALKEFRAIYASVMRQLIALGVVVDIKVNYGH